MSANGKSATSPSAQAWGQPDTNVPVDDTETSTTVTKNHRNRHKKNSSPSLLSLSGNASTPNSQPTSATPAPQVVIDASAYPHILRAIFDRAPFEALLVLGQGCKEFHDLANSHLTHHLVIASNIVQSARGGVPPTFFPPNGQYKDLWLDEGAFYPPYDSWLDKCTRTRIIDVGDGSRRKNDLDYSDQYFDDLLNIDWTARLSGVETLRFHFDRSHRLNTTHISPTLIVYTKAAMPVFKNDRHLRGFDFPPSVNKIVVNVPWCVRDKSHAYRGVFFSSAADYVVVFVETNLYAPPRYVRPNILRPLLGAYAVGFKIAHNSSRPGPRSITFVGLPSDNLFRKSEHLTTEECCVSATDFLRGRLDKLVDDDILSVPRVDEIIGNVNFLSGADYRATVSYRQYLLETSVSPYNLV
ncbi:hypothetical protein CcaverHIS002_0106820 [Cutaneotrichosporon cavernicola]|nr:hypothetical protein CcaverHIS002_0106820 [Cutaneotrichosporon cavernicola]BEI95732.1 hypothetical protein CcaverHIS631_0106810 [Cutaneotrichosporon cavernicola]BEJ03506.1 hypothetical protein CcaverHIS641_0106810 [Cutaneotrichosporon cavernicola]